MTPTHVTPQTVTNASGTIAVASSSTSIGAQKIISEAPANAEQLLHTANQVITTADIIALCSCTILLFSFIWTIYSSRKKRVIDEKYYILRKQEYELERAKFMQANQ